MMVAGTAGVRGALQAKWGFLSAKRPPTPAAVRLLRARRHEEHAVDLVPRRLVLDAVRDAPDAVETPLEEVGGVVEDEPLDFGADLGALLLVIGRAHVWTPVTVQTRLSTSACVKQ